MFTPSVSASLPAVSAQRQVVEVLSGLGSLVNTSVLTCKMPRAPWGQPCDVTVQLRVMGVPIPLSVGSTFTYHHNSTVLAVSPVVGPAAGGQILTITGRDFLVTAVGVTCRFFKMMDDSVIATNAATVADVSTLTCAAPAFSGALPGSTYVEISWNSVDYTRDRTQYTYIAMPAPLSIRPALGSDLGGTRVTISGTGFLLPGVSNAAAYCHFGPLPPVIASLVWRLDDGEVLGSVECIAPVPTALVGQVEVRLSLDGLIQSSTSVAFTYVTAPSVVSVSPTSGYSNDPIIVTVSGANFAPSVSGAVTTCRFSSAFQDLDVAGTAVSDSQLLCPVPSPSTEALLAINSRDYRLQVSVNGQEYYGPTSGTAASLTFMLTPSVVSLSPLVGPVSGGTVVTVIGANFINGSLWSPSGTGCCRFGMTAVPYTYINSTMVQCTSPQGWLIGRTCTVELSGNCQHYSSVGLQFFFHDIPRFAGVAPTFGSANGGYQVSLLGVNFDVLLPTMATSALVCRWGTAQTAGLLLTGTVVQCVAPNMTSSIATIPTTVRLDLSFNGGVDFSSDGPMFTFVDPVRVLSVSPARLPRALTGDPSDRTLTVYGTGFVATDTSFCDFHLTPSRITVAALVVQADQLQCIMPAITADVSISGSVNMSVTMNGVEYAISPEPLQLYHAPSIANITPLAVTARGGGIITVTGANLVNGSVLCAFGQFTVEPVAFVSSSVVHCAAPAALDQTGSSAIPVVLLEKDTRYYLTGSSAQRWQAPPSVSPILTGSAAVGSVMLTYVPLPVISEVTPRVIPAGVATTLTVIGSSFLDSGNLLCRINGVSQAATFVASSVVLCVCAPVAPSEVTIAVANWDSDFTAYSGLPVTAVPEPTLSSVFPTRIPQAVATQLTVTGSNFDFALSGASGSSMYCVFDNAFRTPAAVLSANSAICGLVGFNATGALSVSLDGGFGTLFRTNASTTVTIYSLPRIRGVSPPYVTVSSTGIVLTVDGSNFVAGDAFCRFGSSYQTVANVSSAALLYCEVPPLSALPYDDQPLTEQLSLGLGVVNVSIVDASGYLSGPPQPLRYRHAPVVMSLSPASGYEDRSTTVMVYGDRFLPTSTLTCSYAAPGLYPTAGVWLSMNSVQCSIPACGVIQGCASDRIRVYISHSSFEYSAEAVWFLYLVPPAVTTVQPGRVSLSARSVITVDGSGFNVGATTWCYFTCPEASFALPSVAAVQSSTRVTCVVGPCSSAGSANITLSTDSGRSYTSASSAAAVMFVDLPTVSSVLPAVAVTTGSTLLTVTGQRFGDPSAQLVCRFGGPDNAVRVVPQSILSSSSLVCAAPPFFGFWTVQLEVLDESVNAPSAASAEVVLLQYAPVPSLVGISPNVTYGLGTTAAIIYGSNFTASPNLACWFNMVQLIPAQWIDANSVLCTLPGASDGIKSIHVTGDGVHYSDPITVMYRAVPTVSSLTPSSGSWHGGTTITVFGSNFDLTSSNALCMLGGLTTTAADIQVPARVLSSTQLTCVTPAVSGSHLPLTVTVRVSFNGGLELSAGGGAPYTYRFVPSVLDVTPKIGSSSGGATLTVTGSLFTASTVCRFQVDPQGRNLSMDVAAVFQTASSVLCLAPATCVASDGACQAATAQVTVSNDGIIFSTASALFRYTLDVVPLRTSPAVVVEGVSTTLWVHTSLVRKEPWASEAWCRFTDSTSSVTTVQAVSVLPGAVRCVAPAFPPGSVSIALSTNGIVYTSPSAEVVIQCLLAPTVASVTPPTVSSSTASVITILGSNLMSCDAVSIGQLTLTPDAISSITDTTVMAVLPSGLSPGSHVISLVSIKASGYVALGSSISVSLVTPPTVSGVQPSTIAVGISTVLTVTGTNFLSGRSTCRLDGIDLSFASVTFVDAQTLFCAVPAFTDARSVVVRVSHDDGSLSVTGAALAVLPIPEVEMVSPLLLPSSGATLTVHGSGFHPSAALACQIGSPSTVVSATYIGFSTITCVVPGSAPGSKGVRVSNDGIYWSSSSVAFEYISELTVTSVQPSTGTVTAGNVVTVYGSGFIQSPTLACLFGGVASLATFISASECSCMVPRPVPVTMVPVPLYDQTVLVQMTVDGMNPVASSVSYVYASAPVVESIAPALGPNTLPTCLLYTSPSPRD